MCVLEPWEAKLLSDKQGAMAQDTQGNARMYSCENEQRAASTTSIGWAASRTQQHAHNTSLLELQWQHLPFLLKPVSLFPLAPGSSTGSLLLCAVYDVLCHKVSACRC